MGAEQPIRSNRGHLKVATHPALCDVGDEVPAEQCSERGLLRDFSRLLCQVGSCPVGTVSGSLLLVGMSRGEFSL